MRGEREWIWSMVDIPKTQSFANKGWQVWACHPSLSVVSPMLELG